MNSRNFSSDEEDTSIDNYSYFNLPYKPIDYDKLFKEKRNTKYNDLETNENISFKLVYNQVFNLSKEETIIDNENKEHLIMPKPTEPTKSFISKRKRGRKTANNSNNKRKRNPHDKYSDDNVIKKIQIHYMNFIIDFINDCISSYEEYKKKKSFYFKDFIHKVKSDSSKKHIEELENSTINDLLKNIPISNKNKKCSEMQNKNLVDKILKIEKDNFFKNLFEMKYLELFDYYFNNNEPSNKIEINNKKIKLLKTKLFYELIQKNKEMKERILQVIEKNYKINCKLFIV